MSGISASRVFIGKRAFLRSTRSNMIGSPLAAPLQAETTAWQAAVVTNGGTVSAGRFTIVNNFIYAEKAAGTWVLTDDYWALWGENAPQALTSLKQRRLATVVAAPTFTADRGYAFNGTTNYVSTGFSCLTHAVAMTGTNLRCAVYERTNVSGSFTSAGAQDAAEINIGIRARSGASAQASSNSANINYTLPVADSRGYIAVSRNGAGAAACFGYKSGAALVQSTFTSANGVTLPAQTLYIGARNNVGTADIFRATSIGFACVGASLDATQEAAQYANVQAWATAVGAQV